MKAGKPKVWRVLVANPVGGNRPGAVRCGVAQRSPSRVIGVPQLGCNPPYSDCGAWVRKAWDEWDCTTCSDGPPSAWGGCWGTHPREADRPYLIAMLLPANRVEQAWWQDYVEPFRDRLGSPLRVEFLRGRMRFDRPQAVIGPKGDRPPFGCALLIWGGVA